MNIFVNRDRPKGAIVRLTGAAIFFSVAAAISTEAIAADPFFFPTNAPQCTPSQSFTVADFSIPLAGSLIGNQGTILAALKKLNITTVFRYYDHTDETLTGKTLRVGESDAILAAGMQLGVVFQHHNDDPAKFIIPQIGRKDAERALALAQENQQPRGTAIYFDVDGPERHLDRLTKEYRTNGGQAMSKARTDELRKQHRSYFIESYQNFLDYGQERFGLKRLDRVTSEMMKPVIVQYFKEIRDSFDDDAQSHGHRGYKIGMYCTAAMCLLGDDQKLADYFWVSPEGRNDPEYRSFLKRGHWHLIQQLPTKCTQLRSISNRQPLEFDFNFVKPGQLNFGQWSSKE